LLHFQTKKDRHDTCTMAAWQGVLFFMLVLAYAAAESHCNDEEGTCGTKSNTLLQIRQERSRGAMVDNDSSEDAEEGDGPSPAPQSLSTILEDEFEDVLDPEIIQLLEESSEEGLNACPPVCDSAFLQRRIKNHENKCFMWACLKCDSFKACDGEKPTDEQANKCSNRCKGFIQKMTQRGKSKPQCAAPDCAFCEGIETKCGAFADR